MRARRVRVCGRCGQRLARVVAYEQAPESVLAFCKKLVAVLSVQPSCTYTQPANCTARESKLSVFCEMVHPSLGNSHVLGVLSAVAIGR